MTPIKIDLRKKHDLSKMPIAALKNLLTTVKDKPVRKVIHNAIGERHREHAACLVAAKKKRNHKK